MYIYIYTYLEGAQARKRLPDRRPSATPWAEPVWYCMGAARNTLAGARMILHGRNPYGTAWAAPATPWAEPVWYCMGGARIRKHRGG